MHFVNNTVNLFSNDWDHEMTVNIKYLIHCSTKKHINFILLSLNIQFTAVHIQPRMYLALALNLNINDLPGGKCSLLRLQGDMRFTCDADRNSAFINQWSLPPLFITCTWKTKQWSVIVFLFPPNYVYQ